jgi:SAM-dependent methyltransferase|uniref:class I SAM-dependent methyltransferase n=1 Tax=Nonlabens sp. Ci31 TaxID=2608253 RepID=UPI0014730171|nr:class I SAM-dependent methyltransferase [Nonlabens sp. Ci31]
MSNLNTSDQWFASWFDTPYYHILYRDRDYTEAGAFMQRLSQRLKLDENAHIMDLACGRGRHSMYLNQLGYRVTGVDLSDSSIAFAKAELRKSSSRVSNNEESNSLNPIDASRIEFHVHNMTRAYDQTFDAVFNLFTSFGYFDDAADNLRTIKAIKENLKPGGYGVIDFMNVSYVIKNLVAQNSKTEAGITFHNSRRFENGFIYKEIEFRDNDHDYHFTERVSALTLEDFQRYFAAAGVDLIEVYGSYHLEDYDQQTSDRLIMVFRN